MTTREFRKQHKLRFDSRIAGLLTVPTLLAAWHVAVTAEFLDPKLFPSPAQVWWAGVEMARNGELARDLVASAGRVLAGFAIGALLGVAFGVATGRLRIFSYTLGQILVALRPLPAISIIPFVIIWFGVDEGAKLIIISWAVLFPVWISTHLGIARIDPKFIWVAQTFGANSHQILFRVFFPNAVPMMVAGLRTSLGVAFVSLFAAEMAGAVEGVGYRIFTSHMVFRVDKMVVALLLLGLLGATMDFLFMRLCKIMFPWLAMDVSIRRT